MPKGGRRKGMIGNELNVEKGDNANYLSTVLAIKQLGKTKVNVHKPEEVEERVNQYFELMVSMDKKPTIGGLSLALGFSDDKRLYEIRNNLPTGGRKDYTCNSAPKETRDIINNACYVMRVLWEDYMQNGKINPASGIFLGKNLYGMRDEVEHIVTPNINPADEYNANDIAKRYGIDSGEDKP